MTEKKKSRIRKFLDNFKLCSFSCCNSDCKISKNTLLLEIEDLKIKIDFLENELNYRKLPTITNI